MLIRILILSTIGSLIGWITNLLAIKLLFKPLNPVNIPFFPIEIQGLIPKRKGEIAKSIGETVEKELLSIEEIMGKFFQQNNQQQLIEIIKNKAAIIIDNKLPFILPTAIKSMVKKFIHTIIEEELPIMIQSTMEDMLHKAVANIDISKMVEDRINDFPIEKLEEVIFNIAKKELKHIEVLGAVLGFIIGIAQGIIIILM